MLLRSLLVIAAGVAMIVQTGFAQFSVSIQDDKVSLVNEHGVTGFQGAVAYGEPGQPLLPGYKVSFLLPPDIDIASVNVSIDNVTEEILPGYYTITPALPPTVKGEINWPSGKNIRNGMDMDVYDHDRFFPADYLGTTSFGQMMKYRIVDVTIRPYQYNPQTKKLRKITGGTLAITFPGSPAITAPVNKAATQSAPAHPQGSTEMFLKSRVVNPEVFDLYSSTTSTSSTSTAMALSAASPLAPTAEGYAIITTNAIVNQSTQLANLISQKQARGFNVVLATENVWGGGTGDPAAENIRNWLKANYVSLNLSYVLLIGNPHELNGDVPMKRLWPFYTSTDPKTQKDAPTDYYYAELSECNWDANGNGYPGEDKFDFGQPGGPGLYADVAVGRIPYYGKMADLDKILAKSIAYANATSREWRSAVFLPMKPMDELFTGVLLAQTVDNNIVQPANGRSYRIYDKFNLKSSRNVDDVYALTPPCERIGCTYVSVLDAWKSNPFGLAIMSSHGGATYCDEVFKSPLAVQLNDNYPSMTFQASCNTGTPETPDNLGYSLLLNGAVVTVSASRNEYYNPGMAQFMNSGLGPGMAYTYGYHMITDHMSAGNALRAVRADAVDPLWVNDIVFNIYGCPDLALDVDMTAPSQLAVSAVSPTQINLSWLDRSTGETGFSIERATGSGAFSQIATVGANVGSYANTGLTATTKYRYRVRMYTGTTYSDYSGIDSTTTFTNVAQGKTVTASSQQSGNGTANAVDGNSTSTRWAASSATMPQTFTVNLGAPLQLSGCEIVFERTGTSGDCNDFIVATSTDNTTWTDQVSRNPNTATTQTQTYSFSTTAKYVRITIYDAPGTYFASMYEFRVFGQTTPCQPLWAASTPIPEDQLKLAWHPAYGATSYTVYQSRSAGGARFVLAAGLTDTTFTTTGLLEQKNYVFSVVAFNAAGHSINTLSSNEQTVTAPTTPPAALTSLTITPNEYHAGYSLQWDCPSLNVANFEIQRRIMGAASWTAFATLPYYTKLYADLSANNTDSYEYRVRAVNAGGACAYATVNTHIPPPAPVFSDPYYDEAASLVQLWWSYGGNIQTGFRVELSIDNGPFQVITTTGKSVTNYAATGITPNHIYTFQVCSFNSWGSSAYSTTQVVTLPAAPTNLLVYAGNTQAALKWTDNSFSEAGFAVEQAIGSGSFTEIGGTFMPNENRYYAADLTPGVTYSYRVLARNSFGSSTYSNVVTVTTDANRANAPSALTAGPASNTTANLFWTNNATNQTGCYIERSTDGTTFTQIVTVGTGVNNYLNTGLTEATTYYYRIRAYNAAGGTSYTNVSSVKTFTNIAKGKTATASSQSSSTYSAAMANDNSTTTRWSASATTVTQWLMVDLGSSQQLEGTAVMWQNAALYKFKIELSDDKASWYAIADMTGNTSTDQTQVQNFGWQARYVRITVTAVPAGSMASIYEFRVFVK